MQNQQKSNAKIKRLDFASAWTLLMFQYLEGIQVGTLTTAQCSGIQNMEAITLVVFFPRPNYCIFYPKVILISKQLCEKHSESMYPVRSMKRDLKLSY